MIDDMVALLGQEGKDDAESLDMCEEDFRKTAADKKDTETKIASLESEISELESNIAAGKDTIAKKTEEIAGLDKAVKEATAQRGEEKNDYEELVALNTSAIQLLGKAQNKLNK